MHYLSGEDRNQVNIFNSLDDQIDRHNYVRLIDLLSEHFVLTHSELFNIKGQFELGRKSYSPSMLLKIFFYGYFNGITSSRKLERECGRNIEMMWLTQKLCPDHKTISDFRRAHSDSIKESVLTFSKLLKEGKYIKGSTVSIDGTKVKANASMSIDIKDIELKLEDVEKQISDYLSRIEREEDRDELEQKVAELKKEVDDLLQTKEQLRNGSTDRMSTTDPDARLMKARYGKFFAYNVQMVVDSHKHMIITSEVTNRVNDQGLLEPMGKKVIVALGQKPKEILADKGYFTREQVFSLEKQQIDCYVPQQSTRQQNADKNANIWFEYHSEEDFYTCSKGKKLPFKQTKTDTKRNTTARVYKSNDCDGCEVKPVCTSSETGRSVQQYSDQLWRDEYVAKIESDRGKAKSKQRKMLSEHPFGTIKYLMGQIPLLLRGKAKVATEINLYVLGYNFKRLLNIESFERIIQLIEGSLSNLKLVRV